MNFRAPLLSLLALLTAAFGLDAREVQEHDHKRLSAKLAGASHEHAAKFSPESLKKLAAAKKAQATPKKAKKSLQQPSEDFRNFAGFWLLDTMDDWTNTVLIEFFEDEGAPKAKFYGGTQNHIREINEADFLMGDFFGYSTLFGVPPGDINVCDVEVIDSTSLRLLNTLNEGFLTSDQLTSTFKIQSYDNDIAYTQLWSLWDGVADDASVGSLETLMKFKRLPCPPEIQMINQPTNEWDSPVNLFNYIYDAWTYLGHNERRDSASCDQYIGNVAFAELKDQLLTTGIVRTNTISTEKRNGKYVGVWRTNNGNGITTLRFNDRNYFLPVDIVTISGFVGAYAVLNGEHDVSIRSIGSVGPQFGGDWVLPGSMIPTLHINFDSSGIAEEYNPNIHGVAIVSAQHGPVTEETEYRELMAAIGDLQSAFGIGTHTGVRAYVQFSPPKRLDTYADVVNALADDNFTFITLRGRTQGQAQAQDELYMNPRLNPGSAALPIFDVNDPYGLGQEVLAPAAGSKWDYDIDVNNYLETAYNIWFAITGPVLESEPLTGELDSYLGSNGSQAHFVAAKAGTTPPALVDEYGTHPYNLYQATNLGNALAANRFLGGIVNRSYTKDKKRKKCKKEVVAYIRWRNELGFEPVELGFRPATFGRNDMPNNKNASNEIAALAALLEKLKKFKPTRYIIDIRENNGGVGAFGAAFGALFGANRGSASVTTVLDYPNDPEKTKLVNNSEIEIANNSLLTNAAAAALVNTDLAASVFPDAIVRGTRCKPIDVVILTNVNAGSAGDMFPHNFIGSDADPKDGIHDLGYHVRAQIIGSIDGRLYNGISYGNTPISNPNPYQYFGFNLPLIPFVYEAGIGLGDDTHGIICNQQTWTKPSKLVPSWYEKQWQDIGVIPPVYDYPLGDRKPNPKIAHNTSWRDLALEHAITHKAKL